MDNDNHSQPEQSPSNDPNAVDPVKEKAKNDKAQKRQEERDKERAKSMRTPEGETVQGLAPGATAGYATDVQEADPNAPAPKMDAFGRPNPHQPGPRPTMTPDLSEPLGNPANASSTNVADDGTLTRNLHAGMRATGAKNYGYHPSVAAGPDANRGREEQPEADEGETD